MSHNAWIKLRPRAPGEILADERYPNALAAAERLRTMLAALGWGTGEVDLWRDSGYAFACNRGNDSLEIVVVEREGAPDELHLQLHPYSTPSWLGRTLLQHRASATEDAAAALATAIHEALHEVPEVSEIRWTRNGLADGSAADHP